MIDHDLHKYEIDPKYQETFNNLEKEVQTLEAILKNPEHAIDEEIKKLKRQVDLERVKLKSQIDEKANDLIQKLESFGKRFKENLGRTNLDFELYNSLAESSRKQLEDYEHFLKLFSSKNQEREEKRMQNEKKLKNLKSKIRKLKDLLFSNFSISYKPFKGNIEDLYGKIIAEVSKRKI